jgi:tRNA threonylcarbamoyl adenosine modification protein YeaZ
VEKVVVGLGPGSYTGARIGIAAGQSLSMIMEIPLVGIPSLCAAEGPAALEENYVAVGDARRGSFFFAVIRRRELVGEVELLDGAEALEGRIAEAEGSPAGAGVPVVTFDRSPPVAGAVCTRPSARLLCRIGMAVEAGGSSGVVEPLYLRAPFVTFPREKTEGRG